MLDVVAGGSDSRSARRARPVAKAIDEAIAARGVKKPGSPNRDGNDLKQNIFD